MRGMDKLSAAKNAKTRGAKARALNGGVRRTKVLESVTILVRPGRRAAKRTHAAAEPVEPPHPPASTGLDEDEEPVERAHSPTPTGMDGEPGVPAESTIANQEQFAVHRRPPGLNSV
ncbi:hypothetical protein BDP27DRAFT_1419521 [Rhodocollybia butyracea]|uniref:Uncharacterized protein n=1 Tax=Rhodocollybia butyracea TaxID=206335 RepID=A0A9P5PX29_9AGAR|nr:hypothetical protein BDP27DRAFT_1419521 [Rhodocollybia butyracea]